MKVSHLGRPLILQENSPATSTNLTRFVGTVETLALRTRPAVVPRDWHTGLELFYTAVHTMSPVGGIPLTTLLFPPIPPHLIRSSLPRKRGRALSAPSYPSGQSQDWQVCPGGQLLKAHTGPQPEFVGFSTDYSCTEWPWYNPTTCWTVHSMVSNSRS